MAGDPNVPIDPVVVRRMVEGMVSQLTETKNIQALIDPPVGQNPNAPVVRAIEDATTNLLEPLFMARAAKNPQVPGRIQ